MSKHAVASVEEIPPGERKIVTVAGRSIGVFNVDGEFFALRNRCPHQGGELCTGQVSGFASATGPGEYEYTRRGEILRCPWHGWEFDIRTGQSWYDPRRVRVRAYEVTLEPAGSPDTASDEEDDGPQKGPYLAETYPVSVEQRRIFIEVPS